MRLIRRLFIIRNFKDRSAWQRGRANQPASSPRSSDRPKNSLHANQKLPSDFKLIWVVQSPAQKYSVSDSTQITALMMPSRSDKRGGSRVVTNAGRDVVDAAASSRQRGGRADSNP